MDASGYRCLISQRPITRYSHALNMVENDSSSRNKWMGRGELQFRLHAAIVSSRQRVERAEL